VTLRKLAPGKPQWAGEHSALEGDLIASGEPS
jgi:hypothetical protein